MYLCFLWRFLCDAANAVMQEDSRLVWKLNVIIIKEYSLIGTVSYLSPVRRCGSTHLQCSGIAPPGCSTNAPRRAPWSPAHRGSTHGSPGHWSYAPEGPLTGSSGPQGNSQCSDCGCYSPTTAPSPWIYSWVWTLYKKHRRKDKERHENIKSLICSGHALVHDAFITV